MTQGLAANTAADAGSAEHSSLADEVAAEIGLSLPETARRAAERLRLLNDMSSRLKREGMTRSLAVDPFDASQLPLAGVSTASASVMAYGGLIYGATALAHGLTIAGTTVLDSWQINRVKVGDLDYWGKDERLRWHQILLLYDVLDVLLTERRPRVILIDLPLFISRREEATVVDDGLVAAEWDELETKVNGLWSRQIGQVYPFNPSGTIVASLRPHAATSLFSALVANPATSPDPVDEGLARLIQQEWGALRQFGQSRLMHRMLGPATRSVAYSFEDLALDPRWQPRELQHVGILGFFIRARSQTAVWHIQVPGHRTQWSAASLDRLAMDLIRATLYDSPAALPLPLWYARQLVRFPEALLKVYRERIEEEIKSGE